MSKKKASKIFGKKLLNLMESHRKLRVEGLSEILMAELLMMWVIGLEDKQEGVKAVMKELQDASSDLGVHLIFNSDKPTIH